MYITEDELQGFDRYKVSKCIFCFLWLWQFDFAQRASPR